MKRFLTLLAALCFAATAPLAGAATPKAAEDASAPVLSSDTPPPRVKATTAKGVKKPATMAKKTVRKQSARTTSRKSAAKR